MLGSSVRAVAKEVEANVIRGDKVTTVPAAVNARMRRRDGWLAFMLVRSPLSDEVIYAFRFTV
jgi:hypothetical protein